MDCRTIALVLVSVCSLAQIGNAQVNPFSEHLRGLSKTDLNLLETAAAKLYKARNPSVGASRTWSNPKSGNSGVVRVVGTKKPCVRLRHTIKQKGDADAGVFTLSWCYANGKWQIR